MYVGLGVPPEHVVGSLRVSPNLLDVALAASNDAVGHFHPRSLFESVDELLPGETIVIRSHGVGRQVYEEIKVKGNRMLDATCPFVSRIHAIAAARPKYRYLSFL